LLKDDVGKSKPTTRRLPANEFVYGKPEIRDKEGATESKIYNLICISGFKLDVSQAE